MGLLRSYPIPAIAPREFCQYVFGDAGIDDDLDSLGPEVVNGPREVAVVRNETDPMPVTKLTPPHHPLERATHSADRAVPRPGVPLFVCRHPGPG